MKIQRLSQEWLKGIACATMLIDHLGYMVFPQALWMRMVGRLAFPIYCFLLTEGMVHTHSRPQYMLRLLLTGILSEFAFDLAFYGDFTWEKQSVMVTLFVGAAMLWCMELVKKAMQRPVSFLERKNKYLGILVEAFAMGLIFFPFHFIIGRFRSDYGWKGIFIIAMFATTYRLPLKNLLRAVCMVWLAYYASSEVCFLGMEIPFQLPAAVAILLIGCYSGKKLTHNRALQWSFQLFYPVHLLILWLLFRL